VIPGFSIIRSYKKIVLEKVSLSVEVTQAISAKRNTTRLRRFDMLLLIEMG
jgi:hypothetical protein